MIEVHISITAVAVLVVILILFLVGLLFYLYPVSSKLITIPGPSISDDREGNLNDVERAGSLWLYLQDLHGEYGEVTAFKYGQQLVVSVADHNQFSPRSQIFHLPELLFEWWGPLVGKESFLYATDIEVFKRRDNIDFKLNSTTKASYAKIFRELSKELVKKWKSLPEGQHIPLTQHLKGLATKAVCRMLFGDYFKDDADVLRLYKAWDMCLNEAIASGKDELTKSKQDVEKGSKVLRTLIQDAIEDRWKKLKGDSNMETLMDGILAGSSRKMSEEQILSDATTLLTIGIQVTSAVLTWTFYYLSLDLEVQEALREKLNEIKSLDIMPETLADLNYLKCILKESVRCGEVFPLAGRQQDMDVTVNEHVVPKQTPILEAVSVAMKEPELWEEPCKFNPSRFEEKGVKLNPLDFIPFAFGGSRHKPHNSLVYLLTSVSVASVFQELNLTLAGSPVSYKEWSYEGIVMMPTKEEVWITVNAGSKKKYVETIG